MSRNSTGVLFKVTTFGESHGVGIGVVIDGCPSGLEVDMDKMLEDLRRRRPGQSEVTTSRNEDDLPVILSGLSEGGTTGAPLAFLIKNKGQKLEEYDKIKDIYRPSHADYTYHKKYGVRDYKGGGRSSARVTAAAVIAGSIAKQILRTKGIEVSGYVNQIGLVQIPDGASFNLNDQENIVRCPHRETSESMIAIIREAKSDGDSLGGVITCIVSGTPAGLGEPVFDKLHADLGKAVLGINAVKGVEFGSGFAGSRMKGSEHNDAFVNVGNTIKTSTNNSGGIQGGISNGMDIILRVAFKPTSTISQKQSTVDIHGTETHIEVEGRHDPCVVPRAVPIVEAMVAITMLDHLMRHQSTRIDQL